MRRIRLGMVGGGKGSFIGAVHRIASRIDDRFILVAGALSSDPTRAAVSAQELGIDPTRSYAAFSEMARADKTVSGYQKAVQIYLPAIIAICALALLVVKTPNWQASMVAIIAMMAVIMLVDTNASTRMDDYQDKLAEFATSKQA